MDLVVTSMEYDEKHDYIVYHTGIAVEIPKGYGMACSQEVLIETQMLI